MSNPGGINYNLSPYYDDFDEEKKFVRILFRPGRAVQARELTQLQTLFQKQIERFGNYFFKDGTVIDGCEQGVDLNLPYVKLQNLYNGGEANVSNFLSKDIIGASTGVKAKVGLVAAAEGLDPKTLFINYTGSGTVVLSVNTAPGTLVSGNTITTANGTGQIQYWDTTLSKIYVSNVTGTFTSSEVATTLNNTNTLVSILVNSSTDKRSSKEFENGETLFTLEATRSYANAAATEATTYTEGSVTYNRGSKVTIGDGVIYVANHFIRNTAQTIILDKYKNVPSYRVGFVPEKTNVTYIEDTSLVDNAQGTPNYQAPGADRFKIEPVLTKLVLNADTSETEFVSLIEIEEGNVKKRKSFGLESKLEDVLSKRTYEESGDYTLTNPKINVREHLLQGDNGGRFAIGDGGNTNLLLVEVDPFIAYVKGYRNEFISKQNVEVEKGLDVQQIEQNKTQINYGNYVDATELVGAWDLTNATKVDLYNVTFNALTDREFNAITVNTANKIGEARVRSIEYVSGVVGAPSAVYRLYLFDITMLTGSFADVRGVYDAVESGYTVKKFADIVLSENGNAVLRESSFNTAIFPLPYDAVRTIRDQNNNIESGFTFKREFLLGIQTAGTATVSSGDNNENFVGTGVLSDTQKNENYVLVPDTTANTAIMTGTVTITAGTSTITGSGTGFADRVNVGDYLQLGTELHRVTAIANNISLTLANNHVAGHSGTYFKSFPAGSYINLSSKGGQTGNRVINVISPGATSVSIDLKETFTSAFNARLIATLNRSNAREMKKTLTANAEVYIQANTHPSGLSGPYSLGKADLYQVRAIYQSADFASVPTSANTNVTALYDVDNGQRDNTYEHATITPKLGVIPTGRLLVVFDYFAHDVSQGVSYLSVDSYPIDDVNETSTTVDTAEIPVYTSKSTGINYNLRNSLDFRLRKADVATTINPVDTGAYQLPVGGLHIPKPFSDFDSDLSIYKGRVVKLFLNENGEFGTVDSSPGYPNAQIPPSVPGTLDVAIISVPPYPSSPSDVVIEPQKNRRYTMKDIGKIEDRVNRLEYYTSLNLIEKQATDVVILDNDGIEKFKNGILVDPFIGHNIADVNDNNLNSAVSRTEKFVTAQIDLDQIPLKFNSLLSSGVTRTSGNKLILAYGHETFSRNPYASSTLNLSQQLTYDWTGVLQLYPSTDNWMDTTNYPGRNLVVDLEGTSDNWRKISNAWETEFDSWQTRWLGVPIQQDAGSSGSSVGRIFDVTSLSQYENITAGITVGPTETQSQARVVDVSVNHYMRGRDYIFSAKGLKPNSRLYAFLDGIDVTQNCKRIILASGKTINNVFDIYDASGTVAVDGSVYSNTALGTLYADSTGEINGIFSLPAQTFNIGQREFKLTDDAQNEDASSTTKAKSTLISQGVSLISTSSQINTRPLNVNFSSVLERTNVSRQIRTSENFNTVSRDPLSQSFFIDDVNYPYGVFTTKIDVFFKSKSSDASKKVFMQIREMENGLPTRKVIGDSITFVKASNITTSNDGTVATTFTFDNPIFLLPGNEYCFSLIPEGNTDEFEIWIAELGQFDVSGEYSQQRIDKQPAAGTLFTASNDYVWSVRASQDVKYTIYVADFSQGTTTGTAYIENADIAADVNYSALINNIASVKPDRTTLAFNAKVTDSSATESSYFPVDNLELLKLDGQKTLLDSAQEDSNDVKSITLKADFATENKYISPFIDLERLQSIVYDFKVNNNTYTIVSGDATVTAASNVVIGYNTAFNTELESGEYVSFGGVNRKVAFITNSNHMTVTTNFVSSAANVTMTSLNEENPTGPYASSSRYLTRRVELADGFEANDLNVYVDVNRPAGTNIKVYYKVLSEADGDPFDDKFYQEMDIVGTPILSEDPNVYYEERYAVSDSIKTGGSNLLSGRVATSTSSAVVTGTSTRFLEELRIGDTIRIDSTTKVVSAIANNVSLTADSVYGSNLSDKEMYKLLYNSIVYTTPDNRTYSGYKYFAIKIVFLSNNTAIAPRIKRLRAIALA